jgi:hypothetical protein
VINDDELAAIAAALTVLNACHPEVRALASLEGREPSSRWKFAARNLDLDGDPMRERALGIDYRRV